MRLSALPSTSHLVQRKFYTRHHEHFCPDTRRPANRFPKAGGFLLFVIYVYLGMAALGLALEATKEKSREEREAAIKVWEEERMSEGRRVMGIAAHNVEVAFSAAGPQGMMEAMGDSMNPETRRKA